MTRNKKILIGAIVVVVGAGLVYANLRFKRQAGVTVQAEGIQKRDLEAIVSASGKIRPKRQVNITSEVSGRVTRLAVNEGDRVKTGQFLIQVDPRTLTSAVERGDASLQTQRAALQQARTQVEAARTNLALAEQSLKRQQELWNKQLTTRESLERSENELKVREAEVRTRESEITAAEQRIRQLSADLDSAKYNLSRVTIQSPITGIVTRRNVEEGETAVVGFTNNPSVVLLTIADMSVIEAEIEVDETDIPTVQIGHKAKITIDAIPDKKFDGRVTEIGNSPIQAASTAGNQQATNFRVVVTLVDQIPEVRPGFTCTAEITTATRSKAVTVPIQAMAVRELVFDRGGNIVRAPRDEKKKRRPIEPVASAETLPAGQTRKETEGVFVFRNDTAAFVPVKTGIAGDRYFEVLSGLNEGDRVITGPLASVRGLADGDRVKLDTKPAAPESKKQ
ncbi:MAG: efflux RND transporter periplasmic adaptor subunit [Acidobacteria bacterium]|nr:efflux RND transporter periplasmic adaptor subunit [Acidobacteriota bacterium]